ncbi:MAG: methyltransferase domain-containing protein [Thermoleophilaceae bacterium]|nr:methyltransferase domain-containing protein [Thermoleophilaceae bacterium]
MSAAPRSRPQTDSWIHALRVEIAENPLWYHTLELAPDVVTPGWFDLRGIADRLPWPDLRGKRCLDIGTYDGFYAFEMEKRGAAEVIATDLSDNSQWDWPFDARARGTEFLDQVAGPEKGLGFRIAKRALGSVVERRELSVYDLSPAAVGQFDFVVCGALLLHLRDPLRALDAVHSICTGEFMSVEQLDLPLSVRIRRTPVLRLDGSHHHGQWFIPNLAGHRRMLFSAGFDIDQTLRPLSVDYGAGHPERPAGARKIRERLLTRIVTGGSGFAYSTALCRPRG